MPQATVLPTVLPAVLIVAGPTCSGKSALALALAEAFGGSIVNADAMQVYRELPVLTACPDDADRARAPHHLYGTLPARENGSVAWWREQARAAVESILAERRLPILCGGTGLYLQAICRGLADIPDPGTEARQEARALLAAEGPAALHARLTEADPETAAGLRPSDGQRLSRAWEVWRGTGHGLHWWWQQPPTGAAPWHFAGLLLDPDRESLRDAIPDRFRQMVAQGALDEVDELRRQRLDPALPAMRALGVRELLAHRDGALTLDDAIAAAALATVQYTKRQATWFRHRPLAEETRTIRISSRFCSDMKFSEKIPISFLNKILSRS